METQVFIQSVDEIGENASKVERGLLPAVMENCRENANLVSAYLRQRCVVDGKIDASYANIRRAVEVLVNAISWAVPPQPKAPPKKQPDVQGITSLRRNHANDEEDAKSAAAQRAKAAEERAKTADAAEANKTLLLAGEFILSVGGRTHAATARLRESLSKILNDRPLHLSAVQAAAIFNKIKEKANEPEPARKIFAND